MQHEAAVLMARRLQVAQARGGAARVGLRFLIIGFGRFQLLARDDLVLMQLARAFIGEALAHFLAAGLGTVGLGVGQFR